MNSLPAGYPNEAFAAFELLKSRQTLSVEDLQVLALIECFGEPFYFRLADSVVDAEAKSLLPPEFQEEGGQEERGHAHRMLKAIALKGDSGSRLPVAADNSFVAFAPSSFALDADMIAALEQGEVDGDLTYQQRAYAEPNPEIAELLRQNGREVTRHSERVTAVKQRLAALA